MGLGKGGVFFYLSDFVIVVVVVVVEIRIPSTSNCEVISRRLHDVATNDFNIIEHQFGET